MLPLELLSLRPLSGWTTRIGEVFILVLPQAACCFSALPKNVAVRFRPIGLVRNRPASNHTAHVFPITKSVCDAPPALFPSYVLRRHVGMPPRGRRQRKVEYWKYRLFYVRGCRANRALVLPICSDTPHAQLPSCPQRGRGRRIVEYLYWYYQHPHVLSRTATIVSTGPIFKLRPVHRDPPPTEARDRTKATTTASLALKRMREDGANGIPRTLWLGDRKGTATTTAGPAFTSQ
jgi:hypothetical protein